MTDKQNLVKGIIKQMTLIAQDMEDDVKRFDGLPFNGQTVATYFAHQGAAIAAIADTLKLVAEQLTTD